jgi:hypothetical protein
MSILMLDPVILPSSRKVVDRFVFLPLDVSPHHVHPHAGPVILPSSRKVVDRFVFLPLDVSHHHVHPHARTRHSPLQQEGCRQVRISAARCLSIMSILMLDPVILPSSRKVVDRFVFLLDVSPHHVYPHAGPVILPSSRKVVDRFVFLPLDVSRHHVHPHVGPRHSPLQQEGCRQVRISAARCLSPSCPSSCWTPSFSPPAGRL